MAEYRRQTSTNLSDLASALGISKSTLSRIENGKRSPRLKLAIRIRDYCAVPIESLLAVHER